LGRFGAAGKRALPVWCKDGVDDPSNLHPGPVQTLSGVDDKMGPTTLFLVRHLASQDGVKTFFCHTGTGQNPPSLNLGISADDNNSINSPVSARFEQKGDIKHSQLHASGPRSRKIFKTSPGNQRVHNLLKPAKGTIIATQGLSQSVPVHGPVYNNPGKGRFNRSHPCPAGGIKLMHSLVSVPDHGSLIREKPRRGRLAHSDRTGQTQDDHPASPRY